MAENTVSSLAAAAAAALRRPSLQSGNSGGSSSKRSRASSAAHQQQQAAKGLSVSTSTSTLGDNTYNSGESSREVLTRAFQQQLASYQGAASGNSRDLNVPLKDHTVESPIDPLFVSRPTIVSQKIITSPQEDDEYENIWDRRSRSSTMSSGRIGLGPKSSAGKGLGSPMEHEEGFDEPGILNFEQSLKRGNSAYENSSSGSRRATPINNRRPADENDSESDMRTCRSDVSIRSTQTNTQEATGSETASRPTRNTASSSASFITNPLTVPPRSKERDARANAKTPTGEFPPPPDPGPVSKSARVSSITSPTNGTAPQLQSKHRTSSTTTLHASGGLRSEQRVPSTSQLPPINTAIANASSGSRKGSTSSKPAQIAPTARLKTCSKKTEEEAKNAENNVPAKPTIPQVEVAPASGMYWHKIEPHGAKLKPIRAHVSVQAAGLIYIFGGCDNHACFNDLYIFDPESMGMTKPKVGGTVPPPSRAMTAIGLPSKKIVIFGGGDGPTYYNNDLYVLDIVTLKFFRPRLAPHSPVPSKRRAHTACFHKGAMYVFGGGDGDQALNDVWKLEVTDLNNPLNWKLISKNSAASDKTKPPPRGYHTANMVNGKLIVFGGSDGVHCFSDVWVLDVETCIWKQVPLPGSSPLGWNGNSVAGINDGIGKVGRLSHSATLVGSYLFVFGGHDGDFYANELVLLNLVTMKWDRRKVYGVAPSGRGYHGAVLLDSRLFFFGGFDGHNVFGDIYILDLGASSYYPQISHFSIEVDPEGILG